MQIFVQDFILYETNFVFRFRSNGDTTKRGFQLEYSTTTRIETTSGSNDPRSSTLPPTSSDNQTQAFSTISEGL